jgi:hypothetical protein
MRVLEINNTAIDLQAQVEPFTPGNSMVALNGSAETRVIQQADDSAFTENVETVATLAAAGLADAVQNITPTRQYIRTSAASDPVSLLCN